MSSLYILPLHGRGCKGHGNTVRVKASYGKVGIRTRGAHHHSLTSLHSDCPRSTFPTKPKLQWTSSNHIGCFALIGPQSQRPVVLIGPQSKRPVVCVDWATIEEASGVDWATIEEASEASGVDWATIPDASGVDWATIPEASGVDWATIPDASGVDWATIPEASGVDWATIPEASGVFGHNTNVIPENEGK
ncbi:hypothetical protein Btru_059422 [Bulinus truncatus]|nr:hypothetical protein Btru_059422 [Bulinus truncatus]